MPALSINFSIMFIGLRKQWAYLFNDDPNIVSIVMQIMPLVAFLQLLDGISTLSSGILRSCGRQVRLFSIQLRLPSSHSGYLPFRASLRS